MLYLLYLVWILVSGQHTLAHIQILWRLCQVFIWFGKKTNIKQSLNCDILEVVYNLFAFEGRIFLVSGHHVYVYCASLSHYFRYLVYSKASKVRKQAKQIIMGRPRRSSASLAVDNADAVTPQVLGTKFFSSDALF